MYVQWSCMHSNHTHIGQLWTAYVIHLQYSHGQSGQLLLCLKLVELLFVFVEAVFVAPRSEELGIAS